jgi:ribosomal protein S14
MSLPSSDDVLTALRDFNARIDALDPAASSWGEMEVRVGEQRLQLSLRVPVVVALMGALRDYHDPRDQGRCEHCGGPRLDDNFLCRDCGRPNGVFGRLVAERLAGYSESAAIDANVSGVPGAETDAPG